MKKFCLAVIFLLLSASLCRAGAGPKISAAGTVWAFGNVAQGETKEKTFKIENAGDEELVIESVRSCCGYTVLNISSWEIKPGDRAEFKIISDASKKPLGLDQKEILVSSNDKSKPLFKIPVYSKIVPSDKEKIAPPPSINPGEVKDIIKRGDKVFFLDVREDYEFSEKHIPDAISFPKSRFDPGSKDIDQALRSVTEKDILVVYCGSGLRSSYITRKLRQKGYNAFNLNGGITLWEKEGGEMKLGEKMPPSEEPIIINLEEAYGHYYILFKDKAVWVDVRDTEKYAEGHIEGAINVPLTGLQDNMVVLPKDKELVLYCQDDSCDESSAAARFLFKNGYKHAKIKVFKEGIEVWEESGYPLTN